jgi:hypothetical protein
MADETKSKKVNLKYQRDKDREPVKGIFRFYEVPGGMLSFVFRQYKEDDVERFDLVDGQIYSIPLGVAKHLNKNGHYPIHAYTQNENGTPHVTVGRKVHRFGFQSLEFVDINDISMSGESPIIEEVIIK